MTKPASSVFLNAATEVFVNSSSPILKVGMQSITKGLQHCVAYMITCKDEYVLGHTTFYTYDGERITKVKSGFDATNEAVNKISSVGDLKEAKVSTYSVHYGSAFPVISEMNELNKAQMNEILIKSGINPENIRDDFGSSSKVIADGNRLREYSKIQALKNVLMQRFW